MEDYGYTLEENICEQCEDDIWMHETEDGQLLCDSCYKTYVYEKEVEAEAEAEAADDYCAAARAETYRDRAIEANYLNSGRY